MLAMTMESVLVGLGFIADESRAFVAASGSCTATSFAVIVDSVGFAAVEQMPSIVVVAVTSCPSGDEGSCLG